MIATLPKDMGCVSMLEKSRECSEANVNALPVGRATTAQIKHAFLPVKATANATTDVACAFLVLRAQAVQLGVVGTWTAVVAMASV